MMPNGAPLNVDVIDALNLTQADLDLWSGIVDANTSLGSPFLSPFFTLSVASVRRNVYVARILENSRCIGFFPFQIGPGGEGEPVGGGSSDCHGIVTRQHCSFTASALIHESGLSSWRYHHLLMTQNSFANYHDWIRESPTIEIPFGFSRYCADLIKRRAEFLAELDRKDRKFRREVGKLTFEFHVTDPSVLALALSWKGEQLSRTFYPDLEPWEKELLRVTSRTTELGFRGLVSALYAGDDLVAVHIGIASATTWHYWYPAFNLKYAKYSPGLLLLLKMIREAPDRSFARIDLGKTTYRYKRSFMNSAILLAEGAVVTDYDRTFLHH